MFARPIVLISCLWLQLEHAGPAPGPAPQQAPKGLIKGKALFSGDPKDHQPAPIWPPNPRDTFCSERHRRDPIMREEVLLNVDTDPATLRNVVVSLKTPVGSENVPVPPVVVEMHGCVFRPHVVALRTGQTLRFVNADDHLMNVHLYPAVNQEANYNRPRRGEQLDFQLKSEPPFRVKSDIHPWTSVWVAVFDHPFFAVTGDEGTFRIENVPPGKHVLEAWHEKLGTLEANVEVAPGETETADFTFAPRLSTP